MHNICAEAPPPLSPAAFCSDQVDKMSAAPRSITAPAPASGSLQRELGATLALGWPIILANVAIYAMTATDFIMLGRLSRARARSRGARFQSLSARDGAWHRPRRGAGSDRGGENWRRRERRGTPARDASGSLVGRRVFRRRLDLSLRRRNGFWRQSAKRPISRATPELTCEAISGVCCRTFCSSPPAASSRRLSGRARR